MNIPEGWQLVPKGASTEPMDDAVRGFLMMISSGSNCTYENLRDTLKWRGEEDLIECWHEDLKEATGHIPKASQSDLIYRMMCHRAPKFEG